MSNRSGRSWYRLSSIVRPTPYSSRDPSPPRHVINPPPPQPPLPPPPPRSPPKEANPSHVPLSMSTKHDPLKPGHKHETTDPKIILTPNVGPALKQAPLSLGPVLLTPPQSSHDSSPPQHVISAPPPQPLPPPSPRSLPKEIEEAKPSLVPLSRSTKHNHETTHLTPPHSSRDTSSPRHVINPPPSQPLFPPMPPPSPRSPPKEANTSPIPLSLSTKHDPPKPPSEKTNLIQGPNNDQQEDSYTEFNDAIVNTEGFIITISGENKGAVMEILWSTSKTSGAGKVRRLKNSRDDEGNESKSKSKSKKQSNNGDNLPIDGFVNSNVQMINSSVVYSSTGTHYDPGVHLSLYRKPSSGNGFITKDHGNGYTSSIN